MFRMISNWIPAVAPCTSWRTVLIANSRGAASRTTRKAPPRSLGSRLQVRYSLGTSHGERPLMIMASVIIAPASAPGRSQVTEGVRHCHCHCRCHCDESREIVSAVMTQPRPILEGRVVVWPVPKGDLCEPPALVLQAGGCDEYGCRCLAGGRAWCVPLPGQSPHHAWPHAQET